MGRSFARIKKLSIGVVSVAVVALAMISGARAQDCERLSGPARSDCYTGRARIFGAQSDIAAGEARVRASAERLRAVTGGTFEPRRHKAKPKRKVRRSD